MHIAIDGVPAAKPNKTGVEWYTYYVIKHMNQLRPELDVRVYTHRPLDFTLKGNWKNVVITWPFPGWKYAWSLRLRFDKPRVVFCPGDALPPGLPSTVKTVATVHDLGWKHVPEVFSEPARARLDRVYADYAQRATKLLAVSDTTRADMMEHYNVPDTRIVTTHLGLEHADNRWRPRKADDPDVAGVKERHGIVGPYILFLGRLESKKGLLPLLQGYARWREAYADAGHVFPTLVLAGQPGGEGADAICAFADQQEGVVRTGYVSQDDAPLLMAGAEVFVFPSVYEGFGLPLLEAMASGTPIAALELPINREMLGAQSEGRHVWVGKFVTAPSATEWYHYFVNSMLPDGTLNRAPYKRGVQAGLARAAAFTWEATAQKSLTVLCDTSSNNSK